MQQIPKESDWLYAGEIGWRTGEIGWRDRWHPVRICCIFIVKHLPKEKKKFVSRVLATENMHTPIEYKSHPLTIAKPNAKAMPSRVQGKDKSQ